MGTRCVIALGSGSTFRDGVYVHNDGDPETMGSQLFRLVQEHDGDVADLWKALDSARHGGWSSVSLDSHLRASDEFVEVVPGVGVRNTAQARVDDIRFQSSDISSIGEWGIEYVYVVRPGSKDLTVFNVQERGSTTPVLDALGTFKFHQLEPDWLVVRELGQILDNAGQQVETADESHGLD